VRDRAAGSHNLPEEIQRQGAETIGVDVSLHPRYQASDADARLVGAYIIEFAAPQQAADAGDGGLQDERRLVELEPHISRGHGAGPDGNQELGFRVPVHERGIS
jgi:hypothetical protein